MGAVKGNPSVLRYFDSRLKPSERVILAHWDAGNSVEDIVAITGWGIGLVRQVVKMYDDRPELPPAISPAESNARFLDRLRAVYPALFMAARIDGRLDESGAGAGLVP
jgi:hypothetical protein